MSSAESLDTVHIAPFPYDGPDEFRSAVVAALRQVVDPELAMTIVDVGLIYGVTVKGNELRVRLTMTSAACPVADVIVDDVWLELSKVVPASISIDIDLVWEPEWNSDRMSDRAKRFMGW